MKTFSTRWIIPIFALAAISCTDEINLKDETIPEPVVSEVDEYVYPNSDSYVPKSRAEADFNSNWENFDYYEFQNGDQLDLPWSPDFNTGTIDRDVRKKDGWQMVSNNLHLQGSKNSAAIIILLHNRFSGILKVLYYLPQGSASAHSKAIPSISFEKDQRLLNTVNEVTIPAIRGMGLGFTVYATLKDTPFLQIGWNVVTIPIAYDPYPVSDLFVDVDFSKGLLAMKAKLIGDYMGQASGTLTLSSGSNNIFKSVLRFATTIAAGLLSVNDESGVIQDIQMPERVSPKFLGIGSIFKEALNFFSGTIFGKKSEKQTIECTTSGTLELTGDIVSDELPSGGDKKHIQIDKFKTGVELGVWNLRESPTMYMHPIGVMTHAPLGLMSDENDYTFRPSNNYKYSLAINPQLQPYIKSYTVECFPVVLNQVDKAQYVNTVNLIQLGALSNRNRYAICPTSFLTSQGVNGNRTVYDGIPTETWTTINLWQRCGKPQQGKPVYKYVWGPNHDSVFRGEHKICAKNIYLKVCLTMVVEFEGVTDTIYSSRTYIPKIDWDPRSKSVV